jgi:uncharacterized membrane protein
MKTWRIAAMVLGALYLGFLSYVAFSASELPARVATHFNASGQPDAWMSRSSHLLLTLVFGFAFPLLVVALMFVIRFLPPGLVNIPRRDYWLAAERRSETFAYLFRHSLWFACMNVCFIAGIHYLVVDANRVASPQLSRGGILGLGGAFLVGVAVWATIVIRHFRRAV